MVVNKIKKYILFRNTNNAHTVSGSDDHKEKESRGRREPERVLEGLSENVSAEVTSEQDSEQEPTNVQWGSTAGGGTARAKELMRLHTWHSPKPSQSLQNCARGRRVGGSEFWEAAKGKITKVLLGHSRSLDSILDVTESKGGGRDLKTVIASY